MRPRHGGGAERNIAIGVRRLEVGGGDGDLLAEALDGGDGFERSGSAECVAVEGLGSRDLNAVEAAGEDVADGGRLGGIIGGGAGAVGGVGAGVGGAG